MTRTEERAVGPDVETELPPDAAVDPSGLHFALVEQADPRARPLLEELAIEYSTRYGRSHEQMRQELFAHPGAEFSGREGALFVLVRGTEPVAGGAFRRFDARTAELKRIWTSSAHRRKGYGRLVLRRLEVEAQARGYTRIYLTTGPRQPEAKHLYLAGGYTPLYDQCARPEEIGKHPFEKFLTAAHS